MLTGAMIQKAIRDEAESRIAVHPCEHLRASNIGHPCELYLYLLISHWEEQQAHDVGLQQIFDLGNTMEDYTIAKLKAAGFEVFTPVCRSWRIENPLITGREDVRIKDPETGELFPGEIKGLSPYEWERLNSVEDFYNSPRHYVRAYPSQLLCYMYKFEKELGFFVLTNKLTGAIKVIDVPFDWDRADALLKKGERIYKALSEKDPSFLGITNDSSMCTECQMRNICPRACSAGETIIDADLNDLINQKDELASAKQQYDALQKQIKAATNGMAHGDRIITGDYEVTCKVIHKKQVVIAEHDEQRISIKRIGG